MGSGLLAGQDGRSEKGDTGADRARVAPGAEAMDRADPGHDEAATTEENLGAVNVELTPEDLREIDQAASEIDVQGTRYPEKLEAMTGR